MLLAMTMRAPIAAIAFSGLAALAGVTVGQVTILPGTVNTGISGISDDGTRVAGTRTALPPYFWSQAQDYRYLTFPGWQPSNVFLSGDGHAIATSSSEFTTQRQIFVETDSGGISVIPHLFTNDTYASNATGISRDGSVVCGWDVADHSSFEFGWRWSAASGIQALPGFQAALAMSGDGNTIFGSTGGGTYGMWRNGVTSPVPNNFGRVEVVNDDASIFAGLGRIWNHGQVTPIPVLPGFSASTLTDINEDGTVAVGYMTNGSADNRPAFIWTPSTGTQPLAAYFALFGYDLAAYRFTNVHVSGDGRTFGLTAVDATSARGIIVTVPSPCSLLPFAGLVLARRRRHRHRLQAARPRQPAHDSALHGPRCSGGGGGGDQG